ncbi:aryl-alcohol dehydrogenase (NADP+) [Devosia psychrophila]|uniref:Aryl-alcohol dehydrogenase (NADP+) n=2 Tax=Devosia psychrophila TaxID=728005 RepID=A0A1I1EWA8_9HYPH|nr:aryl-alcohol dehydrogenase (NADP+) [Devosia psychrophila]
MNGNQQMQYRRLGRSGLDVSRLCLGTMMFGGRTDAAEAARIVAHAKSAGVNFIDTADQYNAGGSETVVGQTIRKDRADWILATKAGNPMGPGRNDRGLSRRWLSMACDASLQRLGTDWIDLFYLHVEDHDTPIEETLQAVDSLLRAGKIRYFGISNFRAWRIAEICHLCDRMGMARPVAGQPYYNALNRMPEVEVLPACAHYGLGVVSYSPLARGVLTAKYRPDQPAPEGSRASAGDSRIMETEWRPESLAIAQQLDAHARERGFAAADFAISWLLANRFVTSVLAGPRTLEQWTAYLRGLDYPYDASDEALLNALVAGGHPSTPGYNDPRYPVEGRAATYATVASQKATP